MASTPKVLIQAKNAENVQTTQYTAPANTKTLIDKFTATNYTATVVTLTVNLVPSGGTAANSNTVIKTRNIQPNETYAFPEIVGHVLSSGDFISTIASTATSVVIRASGREIT